MPAVPFVFLDAFVEINSVDLSDHCIEAVLDYRSEPQDATAHGDTTRIRLGGALDWTMTFTFKQDYAASKVDATLFTLVGTTTTVKIRPDNSDGVGATNPDYSGTAFLESYQPMGGTYGELASAPVTFLAAGVLTRATS